MSANDQNIDRMLDAVGEAIDTRRPLLDDWHTDAVDVLQHLELSIARVQHPDDHDRLVSLLSLFAGMWFTPAERDAIWLGEERS